MVVLFRLRRSRQMHIPQEFQGITALYQFNSPAIASSFRFPLLCVAPRRGSPKVHPKRLPSSWVRAPRPNWSPRVLEDVIRRRPRPRPDVSPARADGGSSRAGAASVDRRARCGECGEYGECGVYEGRSVRFSVLCGI